MLRRGCTDLPLLPSIPKVELAFSTCLARSLVSVRITLAPQFCARVRGMTSSAAPTALYGPCQVHKAELQAQQTPPSYTIYSYALEACDVHASKRKGSMQTCSAPWSEAARSARPREMAISTAPPPGTRRGSISTLRATPMASCKLRSTCHDKMISPLHCTHLGRQLLSNALHWPV